MEADLFGDAAEVLRSAVPPELGGDLRTRPRSYGLKVWFGGSEPGREHYEAQVLGPRYVPEASVVAVEIGFHVEHPKAEDNERVLADLVAAERKWRRTLGKEPVAGTFLGQDRWRRISETWIDPDLSDPELPVQVGIRLLDYLTAIEPLRR